MRIGTRSTQAIRFICRNWGSFNALNQTPVMAAIKLPTITQSRRAAYALFLPIYSARPTADASRADHEDEQLDDTAGLKDEYCPVICFPRHLLARIFYRRLTQFSILLRCRSRWPQMCRKFLRYFINLCTFFSDFMNGHVTLSFGFPSFRDEDSIKSRDHIQRQIYGT